MAYLYRHIRLDKNQPFYIGIGTDAKGKYKRANAKDGRNKIWRDIVAKSEFEIEIMLDDITVEEAHAKEVYFISLYGKRANGGILANMTDGGEGWPGLVHTEETKENIRRIKTGTVSPMKGKKSEIAGEKHPMFGKTHSDQLKYKWSIERKGATPWNKGKTGLIIANGQLHRRKVVMQYDKEMNFISEYESLAQAAKITGFRAGSISKAILGLDRMKSHKGFIWKYKKEGK